MSRIPTTFKIDEYNQFHLLPEIKGSLSCHHPLRPFRTVVWIRTDTYHLYRLLTAENHYSELGRMSTTDLYIYEPFKI
jgi:hypothetical protein